MLPSGTIAGRIDTDAIAALLVTQWDDATRLQALAAELLAIVHAGLGGHATLNLYAEAITRMPENPGIPALFRGIFNNAYLPYRDPETLRAFLPTLR